MKSALVTMTKSALKKEHKNLAKVLVKGTLAQRKAEAKKQRKELQEYLSK